MTNSSGQVPGLMACCIRDDLAKATRVTPHGALVLARGDLSADLARELARCDQVAWDVETSGLDWSRDKLGTCQIYADGVGSAIVSISDGVPVRLAGLLEDARVEKVFHHAPFDLRFMIHAWGVYPRSIRCTKVASKLLAPQASNEDHSLQSILRRFLGVQVRKGSVRTSDWSAANLSEEQIDYAVGDVIHLPALLKVLQQRLHNEGLADLYDSCCAFLPSRARLEIGNFPDVFSY